MTSPRPTSRRSAHSQALRRLVHALVLAAGAVAVAVLVLGVVVPRVAGATPYTILTGSMRPALPPGTLVVVRPTDVDAIDVGDVLTYQLESGQPRVVTHRVVARSTTRTGEVTFRTQGDANPQADPVQVRPVQVRGVVWYHLPLAGRLATAGSPDVRRWATTVVVAGLFTYSLWMFGGSWLDRRRSGDRVPGGAA